jgi:hypothetical protein
MRVVPDLMKRHLKKEGDAFQSLPGRTCPMSQARLWFCISPAYPTLAHAGATFLLFARLPKPRGRRIIIVPVPSATVWANAIFFLSSYDTGQNSGALHRLVNCRAPRPPSFLCFLKLPPPAQSLFPRRAMQYLLLRTHPPPPQRRGLAFSGFASEISVEEPQEETQCYPLVGLSPENQD